ncbi:MAG: SUMF1/EgtB/PvdO family nonheme iron enzyme [Kiritimatiellae bacterium]|nr:SUMF1/EgtB/PvdO family nonheme iron enzyme [Kiritimatiellia bacterium]
MKKILMVAALAAMGLGAAPVVEITSVQQQYPWTNTVDITYTSTGIAEENTYYVVFKAYDAASKEIGVITNDLKVSQGSTWVAQWQPPFNVRYENCTMTPYVYKGGMDDYMIVDLNDWSVTYEPMSTQDAANEKYNKPEYKTTKLVLRKVNSGTYKIGHANIENNTPHNAIVPDGTCYYIGIYHVTVAQYNKVMGGTASTSTDAVRNVSWNSLRNSAGTSADISANKNDTEHFFPRLNGLTGRNFDLPTERMWEVAGRAGGTSEYFWGDNWDDYATYVWHGGTGYYLAVGNKKPNAWGIYDLQGVLWEWIRDVLNNNDLANLTTADIYTPVTTASGDASYHWQRGATRDHSAGNHRMSARAYGREASAATTWTGFRVSLVAR